MGVGPLEPDRPNGGHERLALPSRVACPPTSTARAPRRAAISTASKSSESVEPQPASASISAWMSATKAAAKALTLDGGFLALVLESRLAELLADFDALAGVGRDGACHGLAATEVAAGEGSAPQVSNGGQLAGDSVEPGCEGWA